MSSMKINEHTGSGVLVVVKSRFLLVVLSEDEAWFCNKYSSDPDSTGEKMNNDALGLSSGASIASSLKFLSSPSACRMHQVRFQMEIPAPTSMN